MKFSFLPLSAALALVSPAHADDAELAPVVVTATRLPEIATSLPTASVITHEDIATRQASSLSEILQQEAGINIPASGGPLTSSGVFLRGAASKQVLILVDGVRVNDANQGGFDISLLRPDDIERIEIVRGPYSSQYGSDAIGGVIQIFTRKSEKAEVSMRAGHFGTQEYNAGASIGDHKNGLSVRVGYLDTDGFSASNTRNAFGYNPDRDGGLARTAQLSGQTRLTDKLDASVHSSWKDSLVEFDNGLSDQQLGTAAVDLKHRTTENWTQHLQLGWMLNNLDTDGRRDPFAYYSNFFTARDTASWLHDLQWAANWHLAAGIDFSDEQAKSRDLMAGSTLFDKRLQNTGIFLTQYGEAGIFSGSASLREDDHDTFGHHTTGGVTLAAQIMPSTKIYGAYGSAFRAPSANDLYYPGFFGMFAGNPDLQPETSRQGEVGAEYRTGAQRIRLSAYRNQVRNLIAADSNFPFTLANVNRARLQGLELDAGGALAGWNYHVNASSLSAEDAAGNDLVRRPQGSFNARLGYACADNIRVGTEVRSRSSSKDSGQTLGGYTVFNLYGGWDVTPAVNLGARLDNIGDKKYQDVLGYNTVPRSGYLTATYTWR